MDKQTLRNYGSLAKKVLNYACGREQLTENDREYLKNFCDIQSKFAEELFVRNLVAALLKLEEFKVSKKKPETTRTVPHRVS